MKKITTLILITLLTAAAFGQDITGQWNGVLKVNATQLHVVFNISKSDKGYSSTMDSPDKSANGIPVTSTAFENSILKLAVSNAQIEYKGELKGDEVVGTFKQGGQEFPMNLSRKIVEKKTVIRPQDPIKPYPYYTEDVIFENTQANISLAGTLSLPEKEGNFPVVILITGSGPQNRDEEILGHKPFLVIADYLTKNGIAVLRYDDRGIGKSKGDFKTATSADFATDVESAIAYLKTRKEINQQKIGLIGHSEGGLIAPMVAAKSKDINFIILLAAPGLRGDKVLLQQQELMAKASGASDADIEKSQTLNVKLYDLIVKSTDNQKLKDDLTSLLMETLKNDSTAEIPSGITQQEFVAKQVKQISGPWMQYLIKYNPAFALEKVKCPVLAVNGEKDLQVSPKENLSGIKTSLKKGKNKKITIIQFPNLNHLFQECKTGSPAEYATIEQTFSPIVLNEIAKWIQKQTK